MYWFIPYGRPSFNGYVFSPFEYRLCRMDFFGVNKVNECKRVEILTHRCVSIIIIMSSLYFFLIIYMMYAPGPLRVHLSQSRVLVTRRRLWKYKKRTYYYYYYNESASRFIHGRMIEENHNGSAEKKKTYSLDEALQAVLRDSLTAGVPYRVVLKH